MAMHAGRSTYPIAAVQQDLTRQQNRMARPTYQTHSCTALYAALRRPVWVDGASHHARFHLNRPGLGEDTAAAAFEEWIVFHQGDGVARCVEGGVAMLELGMG